MKQFLVLALAAAPMLCLAQTGSISGTLGGFDVVNDTGQPAHGFEIQLEGLQINELYYAVPGGRYGNPQPVAYATGVYLRYRSAYDQASGQYLSTTPANTATPTFSWQDCYLGGLGYSTSGCEHFGQSLHPIAAGRIITVTGRWMVDDPANHGQLIAVNPPAAIPFVTWFFGLPAGVGTAPVVVAQVEAPEPPEVPEKFGAAQWVKIYKTQLTREVTADELTSDNTAVVPEDPTQIEIAWDILQQQPTTGVNGNGKRNRSRRQNQGGIAVSTRSVIRRYELYKYTGAYDAITHEVACADLKCIAPSAGELGGPLSAQNTASNVVADSITATKTGSGNVTGDGGLISCGNACAAFGINASTVSLTASPSGTIFTGWAGACSGTSLSCSFTLNGAMTANATFKSQFTLSVGRSNPGTITGTPTGNDRAIDCGGNCSAKFTDGTVVNLTAVPPAGKTDRKSVV